MEEKASKEKAPVPAASTQKKKRKRKNKGKKNQPETDTAKPQQDTKQNTESKKLIKPNTNVSVGAKRKHNEEDDLKELELLFANKGKSGVDEDEEEEIKKDDLDEIDEIFAQKKSKKKAKKEDKPIAPPPKDDSDWFNSRSSMPSAVRYENGLPVYTMKQLKIGQGGGTPLCPFDCDCCF